MLVPGVPQLREPAPHALMPAIGGAESAETPRMKVNLARREYSIWSRCRSLNASTHNDTIRSRVLAGAADVADRFMGHVAYGRGSGSGQPGGSGPTRPTIRPPSRAPSGPSRNRPTALNARPCVQITHPVREQAAIRTSTTKSLVTRANHNTLHRGPENDGQTCDRERAPRSNSNPTGRLIASPFESLRDSLITRSPARKNFE